MSAWKSIGSQGQGQLWQGTGVCQRASLTKAPPRACEVTTSHPEADQCPGEGAATGPGEGGAQHQVSHEHQDGAGA